MKAYTFFFLDHRSCYINSLGDVLRQLGHHVCFQSSWDPAEVEAGIAYFQPDVLVTVGCDIPLHSSFLDDIPDLCRKYSLFHLYWATEDRIHHEHWSVPFIRRVQPDLVWTIHPSCVERYAQLGLPAAYLNFGLNPRLFPAKPAKQRPQYSVCFVGTTHLDRKTYRYTSLEQLVVPLVQHNRRVDIWGYGWQENAELIYRRFGIRIPDSWLHGYLAYKQTARIYHRSRIVLGVQNARDQITQRTFEIMGAGACMLASRTDELTRLFEDGREIILSDSAEETMEKVTFYLQRPELCEQIGKRARRKVRKEHQMKQDLRRVLPQLARMVSRKGSLA